MEKVVQYGEVPFLTAERSYGTGESLLILDTETTVSTDPRRIQVTANYFVLPPRLLYHSCAPNAIIDWTDMTLKAAQDIPQGDVIAYDYGTSEFDYTIGAFMCECGSPLCVGYFRGFRYLEPTRQAELYERASPYIQGLWASFR